MDRILRLKPRDAGVAFVVTDMLCVGMGMGVPIFCILFGFVVGWYIARRASATTVRITDILNRVLAQALLTSAFTLVMMSIIWLPVGRILFNPDADLRNVGIPMILYEPTASFVGWLVLMIAISPFLQLLTTIFASYLTLLYRSGRDGWGV
jgi:hypothetical protein